METERVSERKTVLRQVRRARSAEVFLSGVSEQPHGVLLSSHTGCF